jgi:2-polyprenyl-6-methoxyphenol hydroxylase-like FAD-dependent oxidoreductase
VAASLREYEQRRMPRTAAIVNESWQISRSYAWSNPVLVWGRDTMLRLTPKRVWRKRAEEDAAVEL